MDILEDVIYEYVQHCYNDSFSSRSIFTVTTNKINVQNYKQCKIKFVIHCKLFPTFDNTCGFCQSTLDPIYTHLFKVIVLLTDVAIF